MRTPTTTPSALRWYWQAMNDKTLHLAIEVDYDQPECGWFQTRVVRGGPMVPAMIWIEQEVGDEGELLSDEIMRCEINGWQRDPYEVWMWLAAEPIEEAHYRYMMARKDYTAAWAVDEPANNPFKKTDWGKVPTPTFTEGKST